MGSVVSAAGGGVALLERDGHAVSGRPDVEDDATVDEVRPDEVLGVDHRVGVEGLTVPEYDDVVDRRAGHQLRHRHPTDEVVDAREAEPRTRPACGMPLGRFGESRGTVPG